MAAALRRVDPDGAGADDTFARSPGHAEPVPT
jgi:hypothetical protein